MLFNRSDFTRNVIISNSVFFFLSSDSTRNVITHNSVLSPQVLALHERPEGTRSSVHQRPELYPQLKLQALQENSLRHYGLVSTSWRSAAYHLC